MEVLEKKGLSCNLGSIETVKCSLKNENQSKIVIWYEIGTTVRELKSEGRIEVNGGTLTIKNVQLHDGGTYECRGLGYTRFYTVYINGEFLKCLESHPYAINYLQRQQHNRVYSYPYHLNSHLHQHDPKHQDHRLHDLHCHHHSKICFVPGRFNISTTTVSVTR